MAQDMTFDIDSVRAAFSSLPFTKALPEMEKMLMTLPHLQASMLKAAVDRQRAMLDFIGHRCDENAKFAENLAAAASVQDIYSTCATFCKDAASQYAAELGKVAETSSRETMKAVEALQANQVEAMTTVTELKAPAKAA